MKTTINKVIRSRAARAWAEGSETRRDVTNLTCNTPLESDNFDIHIEVDDIVRSCVKAQESHRNDDFPWFPGSNKKGYTVPTFTEPSVVVNSGAFGDQIRPRVRQFNVSTDAGTIPTSGGVSVSAIAEAGAITGAESDPTFTGVSFAINKYGALTRVSDELLADSATNIPNLLNDLFGTAFGQFQDKTIINAILAAGTDHVMSAATSVAAGDLTGIFYDLPAQHRGQNAHWIMTSPIGALVAAINASSAGQHVAQDLTTSPAETLLGKTVIYDDNSSNLATAITANNEIAIFGDLNQFGFINREGRTLKRLNELYAGNGQVGFLATERNDAEVLIATAFEILKAASS